MKKSKEKGGREKRREGTERVRTTTQIQCMCEGRASVKKKKDEELRVSKEDARRRVE